jgi:hypothetical protein
MATRRQLVERCAALGLELVDEAGSLEVLCPSGKRIGGMDVHMLRLAYDHPPGAWKKPEAYAALLDDLSRGVEPCREPECDYCTESADDEGVPEGGPRGPFWRNER